MSIYHLHIPRTSGGSIRKAIIKSNKYKKIVSGHKEAININNMMTANFISGHYGITPSKYVDTTFTVLRKPNELTYSYIKYLSFSENKYENEQSIKKYLNDEFLRNSVTNVISKFISLDLKLEDYNKNITDHIKMANNLWFLNTVDIDKDFVIDSINKNNIHIFFFDDPELYSKISKLLNYEIVEDSEKINKSYIDDEDLYNKYFDDINIANSLDNSIFSWAKSSIINK